MSGGFEGPAIKAGVSVAVKAGERVFGKVWPDTSRRSADISGDDLADAVYRRETRLLDQLAAGASTVIDVGFTTEAGQVVGLDHLGEAFRDLSGPARLVMLGEPGAGKTVAAIYLVLALLQQRTSELNDAIRNRIPVPVRVNSTGWDGHNLSAWLVYRLTVDYEVHSQVAKKLVDDGRVLPVLDGLDEMDHTNSSGTGGNAVAALRAVNSTPWRNRPVVVTCRSSDYRRLCTSAGKGVLGSSALEVQPLAPEVAVDYLAAARPTLDGLDLTAWDTVTDQVIADPEGPLAQALSTPWLLGLTVAALEQSPGIASTLAASKTVGEIENQLFGTLIPAAVENTDRTASSYTVTEVQTWLTTLATLDDATTDGTVRLDQIWRLAGSRARALFGLAAGLAGGLAVGLAVGLAFGLAGGLLFGLGVGLGVGLAFGLFLWSSTRFADVLQPQRLARRVPGRSRWQGAVVSGFMFGLAVGLVVGLTLGIGVGLTSGLACGLTFGLWEGLSTTSSDRLRLGQDENRVIRDDFTFGLACGLTFGLAVALPVLVALAGELGVGLGVGLPAGLKFGLPVGLAAGIAVGLVSGAAAGQYAVACLIFLCTGRFAARPAPFLRWARSAGLLRVTGIGFQFRHETYRRWLLDAATAGDDERPRTGSGEEP